MRTIHFLDRFIAPIRSGRKTMTARTRKYGRPGDLLGSRAGILRLTFVEKVPLMTIATEHFRKEGCESPEDFKAVWEQLHPNVGFRPTELVYLHEFEVVLTGWGNAQQGPRGRFDRLTDEELRKLGQSPDVTTQTKDRVVRELRRRESEE